MVHSDAACELASQKVGLVHTLAWLGPISRTWQLSAETAAAAVLSQLRSVSILAVFGRLSARTSHPGLG